MTVVASVLTIEVAVDANGEELLGLLNVVVGADDEVGDEVEVEVLLIRVVGEAAVLVVLVGVVNTVEMFVASSVVEVVSSVVVVVT